MRLEGEGAISRVRGGRVVACQTLGWTLGVVGREAVVSALKGGGGLHVS